MRCTDVRQLLDWFADGELDPEQEHAVREHLESCGACSGQLGLIYAGIRLTQGLPQEAPPARLRAAILAKTVAPAKGRARAHWALWPARAAVGLSLAGAAAAVVFTVVLPGLRTPVPVAVSPSEPKAAGAALEPRAAGSAEIGDLAGGPALAAERPARLSAHGNAIRSDVGRRSMSTGGASAPTGEPGPASEKPDRSIAETEWPRGTDETPSDGEIYGPDLPTADEPEATVPLGEATRIALERSIESDLATDSSDEDTLAAMLSARLDTEELTQDLIQAINERLARAKPNQPARRVSFEPAQGGGVAVPVMHSRFK